MANKKSIKKDNKLHKTLNKVLDALKGLEDYGISSSPIGLGMIGIGICISYAGNEIEILPNDKISLLIKTPFKVDSQWPGMMEIELKKKEVNK